MPKGVKKQECYAIAPGHVNDRPARRPCLWCGKTFNSRGPHNRKCPACTKSEKANKGPSVGGRQVKEHRE